MLEAKKIILQIFVFQAFMNVSAHCMDVKCATENPTTVPVFNQSKGHNQKSEKSFVKKLCCCLPSLNKITVEPQLAAIIPPIHSTLVDRKHVIELQSAAKRVFHYENQFEAARVAQLQKLKEKPWGNVAKKYARSIEEKEEALWKEFFSYINLCPAQIHELIKKYEQEYIKHDADKITALKAKVKYDIPAAFKMHIAQMCVLFGIDPKIIEALYNPSSEYTFSVSRATVQANKIGMRFFDSSCSDAKIDFEKDNISGALAHEMWHILYQDRYLEWLAQNVFVKHLKNPAMSKDYQQFCIQFHHFAEWRADILGSLQEVDYCDGWRLHLDRMLKYYDEANSLITVVDSPLHPKHKVRIEYLTKLANEMKQTVKK